MGGKKSRWSLLALILVALVLVFSVLTLLVGCAKNRGQRPLSNKTFTLAGSSDAVGLDPADVSDGQSFYVTHQVMESLLEYKPDSTEVQPGLAVDWESSKDGLVWTFQLRPRVKFHDGTDFNAEAVKYNFDRWRLKEHPRHNGVFEYYRAMFGGEPGIIKDVQVLAPDTVKFVLSKPLAPFLSNLAMPAFAISSPAALKKFGVNYNSNPVGTGPYKFIKWEKDNQITLERNNNYWGEHSKVKGVLFRVIADNSERLKVLQDGQVDAAIELNPNDVEVIEKDPNLQVILRPSMNVGYLAINNSVEPYTDVKVRQALNHAINKEVLIDAFFGSLAKPAKNPLPPAIWGYNDEVKGYGYDPAKAKALLAEAGYPAGFKTKLWVMPIARPYMIQPWKIALKIQEDLFKVGIEAQIVSYPWGDYIKKGQAGEHQLYLSGWIGDNGDPDNFLFMLLDKTNAVKGAASNIAFFKDDKVHDLLVEAQEESVQSRRAILYKKAQVIISQEAPWVPLVHTTPLVAVKKSVKNWLPHATGTEPFNRIYLD